MKKNIFALLCLIFAAAICLTGCSGTTSAQTTSLGTAAVTLPAAEPTELTIVTYESPKKEQVDYFNQVLSSRGFPATVKIISIDFKNLATTVNGYASNLPAADLAMFYERSILQTVYDRGLLTDMTPMLELAPMLLAQTDETALRAATYNGEMVGYPLTTDRGSMEIYSSVLIRGDILNELGVDVPETIDELLEVCILARDAGLPCELTVGSYSPYAFHRTYDQWPFFCDVQSLVVMWPDGTVEPYAGSDIFYQDAETYGRFREEGVLRSLYTDAEVEVYKQEWDGLAAIHPITFSADFPYADDLVMVQFAPDAGNMSVAPMVLRYVGMSASTKNPELAMQLLELIYTDREVYYSLVYGVEGTDWKWNDEGYADPDNYSCHGFMSSHWDQYLKVEEDSFSRVFDPSTRLSFDPGAYDYVLDTDQLRRIYTSQAYDSTVTGYRHMRDGSADMAYLPDALRILEEAGIDKIVEAYASQYAEYAGLN